jgi:phage-related protein
MPAVAPGVSELRIRDTSGIYRTFYLLKSERGVFVFHAFVKKTQKTPDQEIRLAQRRLREMLYEEG